MEITQEKIWENINNPPILEDLYQSNKKGFSEIIRNMHDQDTTLIIEYWYTRLFYKPVGRETNVKKYIFTAILVIFAWIPIRLFLDWPFRGDYELSRIYLMRIIPIIFSIALSFFFIFGSLKPKKIILCLIPPVFVGGYLLLLLPVHSGVMGQNVAQSVSNAYFFTFVLLWFFILFSHSNYTLKDPDYDTFLVECGEIIVWSTILILGHSVITMLLAALFHAIKVDAYEFIYLNIMTLGFTAAPFVSLLIIEKNKVRLSVIIANIFLPLILISLVVFGVISMFTETKPYEDRNIFVTYNVMMVIVISALVFTSINGINNKIINICTYILPVVTVFFDFITISAVIYRLKEYGISANKITLLGTNIVMLGHLIFMVYMKIRHKKIERNVIYLPLYFVWAFCVVFIFPFIFKLL
jgi:hypothetical protein